LYLYMTFKEIRINYQFSHFISCLCLYFPICFSGIFDIITTLVLLILYYLSWTFFHIIFKNFYFNSQCISFFYLRFKIALIPVLTIKYQKKFGYNLF
jgi:hypothetical protein